MATGIGLSAVQRSTCFKKMAYKLLIPLFGLISLTACGRGNVVYTDEARVTAPYNEVPVSSNFPTTTQMKLQAAQHWSKIADETGKTIATMLNNGAACLPANNKCKQVFINPPDYITEFSRTFHNQLITTMVSSGVVVSTDLDSSIAMHIDVQPVLFSVNRPQYRHAGQARELGRGIWALSDVSQMSPSEIKNSPPSNDALHWFRTEFAAGLTPQMEIVVTVSAIDQSRYLARTTNVYYVTDGDMRLYNQEICSVIKPCQTSSAVGSPPSLPPKPVRKIEITGDCPLAAECCPSIKPCPEVDVKLKPARRKE